MENGQLYIRMFGKMVKVTALFAHADMANAYLAEHPGEGVIAEWRGFVVVASNTDLGE